uniref:Homeobox domain-containing protein n=1 Tax=Timema shepardi TaxID=629360 RepID=A0A7R9ANQ1_TIMSH|nr:unnamed protein product [Timema shepardi]
MANEKQVSMASEQTHAAAEEIVTLTSSSVSTLCAKLTRRDDVWCVDSGATTHMCHDKNSFLELTPTINGQANHLNLFNNRQQAKKKRKSRTAFTNHQIFELEKRFLYQKYLSPADRDEIAGQLGLSNAQVITWFQNRRAKLKRDMEELKKDVETSKILTAHKSFLENVQDLGILKKKSGTSAMISDDKMISALNIVSEK